MKKVILGALLGALCFGGASAEDVVVEEAPAQKSYFDSVYGGLGIGGSFLKVGDEKYNKFEGVVALGAGKTFKSKYYFGGQFTLEFAKNKKKKLLDVNDNNYMYNQSNGVMPGLDLVGGVIVKESNLIHLDVGGYWSKIKAFGKKNGQERSLSASKIAWRTGAGWKKVYCGKWATDINVGYNYGFKKYDVRCNKGWYVRALAEYNLRYGN